MNTLRCAVGFSLDVAIAMLHSTPMRLRLGLAPLALAALLLTAAPASALCVSMGGLCATFWSYDSVFEGTVASIEQKTADPAEPQYERFPYRVVTFDVHRTWRGEPGPRIQLRMTGGPNLWVEDSIDFAVGGRYLVFASRNPDRGYLTTSSCSPTATVPSKSATESLAFLATLSEPAKGGQIHGTIREETVPGSPRPPVETTVTLEGPGVRRVSRSSGGSFEFTGLPAGVYTITIERPPGLSGPLVDSVKVPSDRGCVESWFLLKRTPA